jgi:hypothetical protein
MTQYEMRAPNSDKWQFRSGAAIVIAIFLALLCVALWAPDTLTDSTSKELGWAAIALLALFFVGVMWLGVRQQSRELKRKHRVELRDGKITQQNDAGVIVSIDLARIESIHETSGGSLIVRGVGSEDPIGIPREIQGFDEIKRELLTHHAIEPLGFIGFARILVPTLIVVGLGIMMFASHSRAVRLFVGAFVILIQALWTVVILRTARSRKEASAMAAIALLVLVIACWVLYQLGTSP